MYDDAARLIDAANTLVVIQAENPDGDSLGSALALEALLSEQGKQVILYCPIEIPKYLRYARGWDRVTSEFPTTADAAIIVDTTADVLLGKVLETPGVRHYLETHPVLVIDHHTTESSLSFEATLLSEDAISTSEVIYHLAKSASWSLPADAAENLLLAQLADSLGLSVRGVRPESYRIAADLTEAGAHVADIEDRRRELMKKSPEILAYKAALIERIEYFLDGKLAVVRVPFEEIEKYSDQYNPGALIGDELRLVEGVELGVVIKTYPDGKLTARLRANQPIAEAVAGYFGGGGHAYAAGFRVYENYDTVINELVAATTKVLA